jgi:crotonobetainyl-CoA:carnitine CoA-transferase CaiB-like acyl-CoA transferase
VAVSVRDDADWNATLGVIGRPELAEDRRFHTAEARRTNHDAFDEVLQAWTSTQDPDEAADALRRRGVPAERLLTGDRMYEVDQLDARGFYTELAHPLSGRQSYPGWPFRITPGPADHHRTPSPTLGQHNHEVLNALGLSDDEIDQLRQQRVIGERLLNA